MNRTSKFLYYISRLVSLVYLVSNLLFGAEFALLDLFYLGQSFLIFVMPIALGAL